MSIFEIIKKLFSSGVKFNFKNCFNINLQKNIIPKNILDNLTPKQFEEVKEKSLETAGELEEQKKSELPQSLKEAIAKAIITGTILTNLSTLKQKISKDLTKLNPNVAVSLLIRCDKCGKFFNSLIGGNLSILISSTFIDNIHQCQYCGNGQLTKDNSDYFVEIK